MAHKPYTPDQIRAKIEEKTGYVSTGMNCERSNNVQVRDTVVVAFECERTTAPVYADVTYTAKTPNPVVDDRIDDAVAALQQRVSDEKLVLRKAPEKKAKKAA